MSSTSGPKFPTEMTEHAAVAVSEGEPFPESDSEIDQTGYPPVNEIVPQQPIDNTSQINQIPISQSSHDGRDATELSIVTYTNKSFKVVGNSRPYKFTMRKMGGKWNRNLEGGPGWIFSNMHQEAVVEFVENANNGKVEPDAVHPTGYQHRIPYNNGYGGNNTGYQGNNTGYQGNNNGYSNSPHTNNRNNGSIKLPVAQKYGDNRKQQAFYTFYKPRVGMSAKINEGTSNVVWPVINVSSSHHNGIIDEAQISWTSQDGQCVSELVTINGKWKVLGKMENHSVIFI